jgi:hypothetical protein
MATKATRQSVCPYRRLVDCRVEARRAQAVNNQKNESKKMNAIVKRAAKNAYAAGKIDIGDTIMSGPVQADDSGSSDIVQPWYYIALITDALGRVLTDEEISEITR